MGVRIETWSYKTQSDAIRHIGPTAQDFRAAFGLGESERHISSVDAEGVSLAAVQALNRKHEAENAALKRENAGSRRGNYSLRQEIATLKREWGALLDTLESGLDKDPLR